MKLRATAVLIAAGWTAGCTAGLNYQRPTVQIPQNFRAPDPLPAPQATPLADLKWWEVFRDDKLQDLIRTALTANYHLRDAVARVEEARANLGVTRSNQLAGIHFSGTTARPLPDAEQTEEEMAWVRTSNAYWVAELDYFGEQSRKPQTVAFALSDNPLGTAAWIVEKLAII